MGQDVTAIPWWYVTVLGQPAPVDLGGGAGGSRVFEGRAPGPLLHAFWVEVTCSVEGTSVVAPFPGLRLGEVRQELMRCPSLQVSVPGAWCVGWVFLTAVLPVPCWRSCRS